MRLSSQILAASTLLATVSFAQDEGHGTDEADLMGPAAFLWPSDRIWHEKHDNTAPCGSSKGPGERTKFPLVGGNVAFTIDDPTESVQIRVSYKDDPQSNDDFEDIIPEIARLTEGHQCYRVGDIPRDVEEGDKATFQLEYRATEDGKKQTFYACADIEFVAVSRFTEVPLCFNVTSDQFKTQDEVKNEDAAAGKKSGAGRMMATAAGALVAAVGVASFML